MFVGLWLVPKYVEPSELGAVMPLTQLANFFAIPIAVFASTFRFGYMKWMIPLTLLYPAALLFVTGYGYFTAYLPASLTNFLATHNITSLSAMLWWKTAIAVLKALVCALAMLRLKPSDVQGLQNRRFRQRD